MAGRVSEMALGAIGSKRRHTKLRLGGRVMLNACPSVERSGCGDDQTMFRQSVDVESMPFVDCWPVAASR